jgi:hypothetical protein
MKLSKTLSKILTNEYVLYFVLFLAGVNVLGFLLHGKISEIIFFALVAYLTSHFSKNLIIIFAVAIVVTSFIHISVGIREGLENATTDTSATTGTSATDTTGTDKKKDVSKDVSKDTSKDTSNASTSTNTNTNTNANTNANTKALATSSLITPITTSEEDTTTAPAIKGEGMNVMSNKKRNRIDYASTIEDAYDDLDKILGGEGIKRLTDDTQKLMGQQLQLADAMKQMSPLLENAKSMLKGFDMSSLNSIAGFAKNFGGGASGP